MAKITPLNRSQALLDDEGKMTPRTQIWAELINQLSTIEGSGSPEGVVEARSTRLYMDTGNGDLYIKHLADVAGDRTSGWVLV